MSAFVRDCVLWYSYKDMSPQRQAGDLKPGNGLSDLSHQRKGNRDDGI